jgi:HEAT repeat protein
VTSAGPALQRLLSRPEQVARRAAVTALAALGAGGDPAALLSALDDEERDVRMAALDALARLRPEGAGEALAGRLDPRRLESMEPVERVALLRTAGALAPQAVVGGLARILTGRKWWGGRWSPVLRASAARALGLLDSDEARATLRRAADDREPAVQSAVRAALRESADTGGER